MNKMQRALGCASLACLMTLTACGGGGGNNDVAGTVWCPAWEQGDAASYTRTETVSGVSTETQAIYVVTARDAASVSVTDGLTARTFEIVSGTYVPESELDTVVTDIVTYSRTAYLSETAMCPPPGVGDTYEYETSMPGPFPGSVEMINGSLAVVEVADEPVSVPAGDHAGRRVSMEKTFGSTASGVSRYYVAGLGVVKEVESVPSTRTTLTEVLSAYDEDAAPMGTIGNPVVVAAGSTYDTLSLVSYVARIGAGSLHFRLTGLYVNNEHEITLSEMTDNADLYIYADAAFESSMCSSINTAEADESCLATTTAEGELYIRVDGSLSTAGTDFALRVGT